MISDLFISRPRLASVISIVLIISGLLAIFVLPISQYPNVAPPTVSVSASYPGSSAQAVADAVAAPLEEAINGVENMIYMSSTSTDAGTYNLSITFAMPGIFSPTRVPGTLDEMVLKGPRISLGASGFMSNVSIVLRPPLRNTKMNETSSFAPSDLPAASA